MCGGRLVVLSQNDLDNALARGGAEPREGPERTLVPLAAMGLNSMGTAQLKGPCVVLSVSLLLLLFFCLPYGTIHDPSRPTLSILTPSAGLVSLWYGSCLRGVLRGGDPGRALLPGEASSQSWDRAWFGGRVDLPP